MAPRKTQSTRPRSKATASASGRLTEISKSSAQIVQHAAALLDEEFAAGIVAAKQMQQRFRKERRIDTRDFKDALDKFQSDAHEVVNLMNDRLADARSEQNVVLMQRLVSNTHSVVDLAVELVNTGAEIADQLAKSSPVKSGPLKSGPVKKTAGRNASRNR